MPKQLNRLRFCLRQRRQQRLELLELSDQIQLQLKKKQWKELLPHEEEPEMDSPSLDLT